MEAQAEIGSIRTQVKRGPKKSNKPVKTRKKKMCVVTEFNIKEICLVSPVVEEASTPRPSLEKGHTLLQHYNGCVSRDGRTESKLFTSRL